jgi:DNA-binding transcriptional ArsR family regulator
VNNHKKSSKGRKDRKPEQAEVVTLTDLAQIKLLAEPIRLRLLAAFGDEKTTKQVADELGEKPTRLYHHVEALERAGLIVLTRTAPKRGTTEKYYLAIARTFRGEVGVLPSSGAPAAREVASVVRTMLATTADEAEHLLATGKADVLAEEGMLGFLDLRIGADQAKDLRRDLTALLARLQDPETDTPAGDTVRCRLTIAFFPLEPVAVRDASVAAGGPRRPIRRTPPS